MFNRLANVHNHYQGNYKRVLCICSAGLLRSPTAAWVLSNAPYNFNTRAVGLDKEYALIPVDDALIEWADEILTMNESQLKILRAMFDLSGKPANSLGIPDSFEYRNPDLIELIKQKYGELHVEFRED